MKSGIEVSLLEVFLTELAKIWSAGGEAVQLKKELNVRSLDETASAAELLGCVICYADLPRKVSGFAEIIEGKPHIVLNRAKSRKSLEYTLSHELGHQVLHLSSPRATSQSRSINIEAAEFEADLFAAMWIMWLGNERQRKEVFLENPESSAAIATCLFSTVFLAVIALLAHVCSKLFRAQHTALPEAK
jgi:Zn-dependent peptidase ImmA (M78 family)